MSDGYIDSEESSREGNEEQDVNEQSLPEADKEDIPIADKDKEHVTTVVADKEDITVDRLDRALARCRTLVGDDYPLLQRALAVRGFKVRLAALAGCLEAGTEVRGLRRCLLVWLVWLVVA